jgi:aspartate-semialdehyde dehydrogenase
MSSQELIVVDQAGATGLVAEKFRQVAHLMGIELGEVATAQADHVGNLLGDEDPTCPEQWADKRLISLDDMARGTGAPAVFSGLRTEEAAAYEDRFAAGRLVVTNSAANRMRDDVALVSAYVNSEHIDQLYERDMPGRIIAGGNCFAAILTPVLAPLQRHIGITDIKVETLQGWSGTGAREVPVDVDDIKSMEGTPDGAEERKKIQEEPNKMLGDTIDTPATIGISAHPNRARWLRGHQGLVTATLAQETNVREVQHLWRYRAPGELDAVRSQMKALSGLEGINWPHKHEPIKPVKLLHSELVRYVPIKLLHSVLPMRTQAHLKDVSVSDPRDIVFEVAGDNLILGAVGGNLLNLLYARAKGYI